MSFRCPGCLDAKSLLGEGDCRDDYVKWFFNPALTPYRKLIDAVYLVVQYRGDDPVLLICDVSPESSLLFRFTMKTQDRKGRNHQRYEVMKVERSELPSLINGEFKAIPDERTKEFIIESVEGVDLPRCECHTVQNELFNVYARNPKAYWLKSEDRSSNSSPQQRLTGDSGRAVCSGRTTVSHPKNDKKRMSNVLFALLIASFGLGAWNYFQSTSEIKQLHNKLKARDRDVEKYCAEIMGLRSENSKLQAKVDQFEEWVKTRSNFEMNKVQLKTKFDEIIKNFREAEDLLAHMDETPKPVDRKSVMSSASLDVHGRNKECSSVRFLSEKNSSGHEE